MLTEEFEEIKDAEEAAFTEFDETEEDGEFDGEVEEEYEDGEYEDEDDEYEDEFENCLSVNAQRDMAEADFETIARLLQELKDEPELFLSVDFDELLPEDPIAQVQACVAEEGFSVAVVYDLSEEAPEQEQQVLVGAFDGLEAVTNFFRLLCVSGRPFRKMSFFHEFEEITE